MPNHILLYTDDPGSGGVAQYNHAVVMALAHRGDRVTVVQSYRENPLLTAQQQVGIEHRWLPFDTLAEFQRTFTITTDAVAILQDTQPDLIVFSDSCPVSSFAAKQVAVELQIPYLAVIGFVAPSLSHHFSDAVDAMPILARLEQFYVRARAVVAVSQNNLDLLRSVYYLPTYQGEVIHYGRSAAYFAPRRLEVRQRLRSQWSIPDDAVLCFTPARLEPIKGFQYQLDAILQLRQCAEWERLQFAWAGEGSLQQWLEQAIQQEGLGDRVHLLGQRWDIADWLDAADIFILPSEVEGMPLAIMEAMAKSLPVVASAVSGIPEELADTGLLLPDPNINANKTVRTLVQAITMLVADADRRSVLGQAARQRAERLFTEDRMIRDTLNVIDRSLLPLGDYVSPGFAIVRPDAAFPHKIKGDFTNYPWIFARQGILQNAYVDQRLPSVGFLSRDEAHILYNTALQFQGKRALEIGCWVGWSACHLALAGVELDVIDPLLERSEFMETVQSSLTDAGVRDRVSLIPGYSPAAVHELAQRDDRRWSLMFIDGNHEAPGPLEDAIACAQYAEPDALVLFHDLASPDVSAGLDYFKQLGWQAMIYQTAQIMGVAWRGSVQPIAHQPDPKVNWTLPVHLQSYEVSGMSSSSNLRSQPNLDRGTDLLEHWLHQVERLTFDSLPAIAPDLSARQHYVKTLEQGKQAYINGDLTAAMIEFQAMLAINPASAIAHAHLSTLWRSQDLTASLRHHALAYTAHTLTPPELDAEFLSLYETVQPYTLLSRERLFSLYNLIKQICLDDVAGDVVECGTYRGGAAALMATVIQRYSLRPRKLYACDTFTGMPDPTEADRHEGVPANLTSFGAGTLPAPVQDYLHQICQTLGISDIVVPVPGLFADTLPLLRSQLDGIALLHADGDWYESTRDILTNLYERVVANGFIQIDDYGHWEGCRQAVDEFARSQTANFPLRVLDYSGVWFRKTDPADENSNWWRSLWQMAQVAIQTRQVGIAKRILQAILKLLPGLVQAEQALVELGVDPAQFAQSIPYVAAGSSPPLLPFGADLNLRSHNWVAFPDWQQSEEIVLSDLIHLLQFAICHPDRDRFTLLLVSDIESDQVELLLATASLQLFETESLEVDDDGPFISITSPLRPDQWQLLLPLLSGQLQLSHENQAAIIPLQTAIAEKAREFNKILVS